MQPSNTHSLLKCLQGPSFNLGSFLSSLGLSTRVTSLTIVHTIENESCFTREPCSWMDHIGQPPGAISVSLWELSQSHPIELLRVGPTGWKSVRDEEREGAGPTSSHQCLQTCIHRHPRPGLHRTLQPFSAEANGSWASGTHNCKNLGRPGSVPMSPYQKQKGFSWGPEEGGRRLLSESVRPVRSTALRQSMASLSLQMLGSNST